MCFFFTAGDKWYKVNGIKLKLMFKKKWKNFTDKQKLIYLSD